MPLQFSSPPRFISTRFLLIPALLCAAFASTTAAVRADSYHSVEAGETLNSIAVRYHIRAQSLREANGIAAADDADLPSMLLRIPDANGSVAKLPALSLDNPTQTSKSGKGSIARSLRYTVQAGDTLESIAAQYQANGSTVTAQTIRDKNNLRDELEVGRTILIPIATATYRANASAREGQGRTNEKRGGNGDAVRVSEQFDWPVATVVPNGQPVYQSPNITFNTPRTANRRGPSVLGGRGYIPNPNLDGSRSGTRPDGLRVLQPTEEAPNSAPNSPRSRMMTVPQQSTPTQQKVAQEAEVSVQGARIRRLPDSEAVSLYMCPVKTRIAVIRQSGNWSAILMSDNSTGWIATKFLRFTGESHDISSIKINNGYNSFQRYGRRGIALAGNFSSNNPMVASALTYLGTPYVYGGESRRGIDCSSLVQHAFAANGVHLPRTAAEQARVGNKVDPANLQAGDRLYFSASGSRVDHTGLYMGEGLFVQASGTGRSVIVSNLYDRWNWNIFVGARR